MRTLLSAAAMCAIASVGNASSVVHDIPLSMETTVGMRFEDVFLRFDWQAMFIASPTSTGGWGASRTPAWATLDTITVPSPTRVKVTVERCGDVWKDLPPCVPQLYAFGAPPTAQRQQQVQLPARRK